MKKINNKGFVLAETLVVTVFIMTIFTIIYVNFYPLIAEYQKREFYDDIDSKYNVYWYKRMIQSNKIISSASMTNIKNSITANGYYKFSMSADQTCTDGNVSADFKNTWTQFNKDTNIVALYITGYHLAKTTIGSDFISDANHFKSKVSNTGDQDLEDYTLYLPDYTHDSPNGANYRIIAEFNREYGGVTYKSFATIEVKK